MSFWSVCYLACSPYQLHVFPKIFISAFKSTVRHESTALCRLRPNGSGGLDVIVQVVYSSFDNLPHLRSSTWLRYLSGLYRIISLLYPRVFTQTYDQPKVTLLYLLT